MKKSLQKELLKIVNKNYEDISIQFSETRKKYLWPELSKLAEKVKSGEKVMDLGCGNGRLAKAFQNKNIKYLGIDNSDGLIKEAKKENKNSEFMVGNVLKLSKIPDRNFDHIFCIAVLHHIPDKNLRISTLKQMRDKLNKNGKIILSVWNMWSPIWQKPKFSKLVWKFLILKLIGKNKMDFGDILFDWKNNKGKIVSKRYYHAFTKYELKSISRKAGLTIQKIYKDNYNYYLILTKTP